MPMNRVLLVFLVAVSTLLVGCASSSSTSVVNADGTWTRTLKLMVREAPNLGGDQGAKPPEIFGMPAGTEWAKSEQAKDDGKLTTLKRTFKAGEGPVTDIIIKDKAGTRYKNFVVVRKLDGNRIEYYEKIVMVGEKTKRTSNEADSFKQELKPLLPAGLATDADLDALSKKTETALARLLFGPDDHMFGGFLTNIDGTIHRLRNKIGVIEDRLLAEQFGEKLSADDRRKVVIGLLAKFDENSNMINDKKPSPNSESDDSGANMVGMSVAVKLPGKVVETNGEVDNFTGEIFWDFMSSTAEPDVLELRAICQL